MLAWVSNTIPRPRAKRAVAIAIVNACGNIGSIPGAYIWPKNHGPYYRISFGASLAILCFAILAAFVLRTYLKILNGKLDREEAAAFEISQVAVEQTAQFEGETVGQATLRSKNFRYLY
jgi:hypothetical protein